ncbi:MAG: hypothetical protein V8Q84_01135 [Bilophila sp.]
MIAACASCCKTLREAAPDMVVVSLWEVLDAECPFEAPSPACCGEAPVLSVHNPCSARHDEKWRGAVRSLLAKRGVRIENPG